MRRAVLSVLTLLLILVTVGTAIPASAAGGVFVDVKASTPFAADIEWLAAQDIAQGGADGRFRPKANVTRQAMAVFLYKFANPGTTAPSCTAPAYRDVPKSSSYCGSIRWLDDARITSGTASGGFAPLAPVTRQSMAAFLYHLEYAGAAPPGCTKSPYADVPKTSPFCGAIDWLYAEGVTTGALHGNFDPTGQVSRGMMAAFLHRFHLARTAPLGVDVSHNRCGWALPTERAFGIVGVNAGLPRSTNPCFAAQKSWAEGSSGGTSQPKMQVYVNTANPANPGAAGSAWPCADLKASCAYQYGVDRAREDLAQVSGAAGYVWWLDVETENSWETSRDGKIRNRKVLEGMVDTMLGAGVAGVGLYSSPTHWSAVVGSVPAGSSLLGRPSWIAGATGVGTARQKCAQPALTAGGTVVMVQFVEGGFDRNVACA